VIQSLIVKWIIKAIMKAIEKKHDLKKIDNYVNKPNELDKKVQELENTVTVFNKCFDNIEDNIKKFEKDIVKVKEMAHKPVDWLNKIEAIDKELKVLKNIVSTSSSIKDKFKKIRRK